jgi:hypothetical protein
MQAYHYALHELIGDLSNALNKKHVYKHAFIIRAYFQITLPDSRSGRIYRTRHSAAEFYAAYPLANRS